MTTVTATATSMIGKPADRVDGQRKVTGRAEYAAEVLLPGLTHAVLLGSTVASGRIERLDTTRAARAPGVLLVLTHENRGALGKMPSGADWTGMTSEPRPPLQDDRIHYYGQTIAFVVAETLEQAQYAASLIEVQYQLAKVVVAIDDPRAVRFQPRSPSPIGEKLETAWGDTAGALASAPQLLVETYRSPNQHPCALEPHATVAVFRDGALTVYDSTQWVLGDRTVLAAGLAIDPQKVRVLAPFVGGMFGSKAATGAHTLLAALAAIRLGRPVKAVLTRRQVLTQVAHRTETVQRFELGAQRDGRLIAMRHHTITHAPVASGFPDDNEYTEATSLTSRLLYACPSYASTHESVCLNVVKPGWMRAPGEAPCLWALESAMDELAHQLEIDPVDLRRRNHTEVNPESGKPFSEKHLLLCYERGARRFGWEQRTPKPGSMRDGDTAIGWGMATASYAAYLMGATARVRLQRLDGGVLATVSTAGSEVGQGAYTTMSILAADGLALPIDRVKAELGDSCLSPCAVTGGSNLTASLAPAIDEGCRALRQELLALAARAPLGFPGADQHPDDYLFEGGRIRQRSSAARSISYADLLAFGGHDLSAEATTQPVAPEKERFSFQSFGAQFVEVRVDRDLGQVRVSKVVGVYDVGRVINAKALRSQLVGGVVFGIGQALLEGLSYDPVHGQPVNADLGGYLIPVNADVPPIDVSWLDEPDLAFNTVGCRGAGEIGITGVAAAIANAVFHATGVRVRELPIVPERLL